VVGGRDPGQQTPAGCLGDGRSGSGLCAYRLHDIT
jgi:hypothetical protein